jgi:hypothetical protein
MALASERFAPDVMTQALEEADLLEPEEDPALTPFLTLLETDIARHPERLEPVRADLVQRLQTLVGDLEVDLDASLPSPH